MGTIITTAVTVLVSLIITFVFNGIINRPKKKQEQQAKEDEERKQFREDLLKIINDKDNKIYEELKKLASANEEVKMDLVLCKLGLQSVIKNNLKTGYEKWINKRYAPSDAKDDLERMYQVYHKLGANGVMDSLREKFLDLPDSLPKKIKN